MEETRSLARALAGPTGPSHHMEYFLLFFWNRLPTGERKKSSLGNKERPNNHTFDVILVIVKILISRFQSVNNIFLRFL